MHTSTPPDTRPRIWITPRLNFHFILQSAAHRLSLVLTLAIAITILRSPPSFSQPSSFVTRRADTLVVGARPFFFNGANAYYLMESAARGDSATVDSLFETCRSLGTTVVRTWGFFDSDDSLNRAVIQFSPGRLNEQALRALDYVIFKAKQSGVRLLIPLVNSWDDYGGMNQYVRWRATFGPESEPMRYSEKDLQEKVAGAYGRQYRRAISSALGHDDFYTDPMIKGWFKNYTASILGRVNTITGGTYLDEPSILGWELANEPRSSDQTGRIVNEWVRELSSYIKSLDTNHLVGTGEEGFEVSPSGYSPSSYGDQSWLFDGTAGVSFTANSSIPSIDFASVHLYPEGWNLPVHAGNLWIEDHAVRSSSIAKPMILGEYGIRTQKAATYESWLTTIDINNVSGALVWQLLEGGRSDREGFGFRCPEDAQLCEVLERFSDVLAAKTAGALRPLPAIFRLHQNYPNPFNFQTTIPYDLTSDAHVVLSLYSVSGQHIVTLVDRFQRAGFRRELLDGKLLSSGAYFYRLEAGSLSQVKKLILMK